MPRIDAPILIVGRLDELQPFEFAESVRFVRGDVRRAGASAPTAAIPKRQAHGQVFW